MQPVASYPRTRLRRTRRFSWSRDLVREHSLTTHDLIWPLFIIPGENNREPVSAMPGVERLTIDRAIQAAQAALQVGIPVIALFPVLPPALKTADGREAINPDNLMCQATRAIKAACPDIGIMCDVALDPYTTHGHDGIFLNGEIVNDATNAVLEEQALVLAQAGCDIIAPSDMQDGRIGVIRDRLEQHDFHNVMIMAYAAKYASAFYGPFRSALGSESALGKKDKRTYQQDPANTDEALREIALDIQEGADMVMVKPGMPYLDVIWRVKQHFRMPTFAYQVSGEYAMLKAAANQGWLDFTEVMLESLLGFKRAGASGIITYAAYEVAQLLNR